MTGINLPLPKDVVMDYDNSLLTQVDHMNNYFFAVNAPETNHILALQLIKYAVESRLNWTPEDMRDHLTLKILSLLKLRHVLQYIKFPDIMVPENDLFYIAWLIYPQTKNKNESDIELAPYIRFLNRESPKMPKEFFTGAEGMRRAGNCLAYAIDKMHPFHSEFDMYEFFSKARGRTFLSKARLLKICNESFESALEFLHSSLPEEQQHEIFFQYFNYLMMRNEYKETHPYPDIRSKRKKN